MHDGSFSRASVALCPSNSPSLSSRQRERFVRRLRLVVLRCTQSSTGRQQPLTLLYGGRQPCRNGGREART